MIEIINVKKTYDTGKEKVEALKGVSLKVEPSDIYGVVGYSGAGKSTLIRCINLLERPDSGSVFINGTDIMNQSQKQLEKTRQRIGMIFQHFNLLRSKTVYENVAFPLRYLHKSKKEIKEKVTELLALVDLRDKADSYPSQLSGGQKQRVAIARALASEPQILLSDEATSALDPQTTDSILHLLLKLNRQLGLTIVLITHEMYVIKEICSKVAIMENGSIVEQGDTFDIFSNPKSEIAKRFTASMFKSDSVDKLLSQPELKQTVKDGGRLLHLMFVGNDANNAYISEVIKKFGVDISIIYGAIELVQSKPIGSLYIIVKGDDEKIEEAIGYLKKEGVHVSVLSDKDGEVTV